MNSQDVDNDIRLYIDRRLKLDKTLSMLSESLKEEVRNSVLSKSNGMFRYAQCEMDHLASQRIGRGVPRALSDMPSNLNETYKRTLENIRNTEDRRVIKRASLWLAYSLRPLKLQELADAVVVEEDDDAIDDDIRLHDPTILLEYANGLFEFNPVTQAVSLSHSSIKTFLTSDWIKNSSASYFALSGDTECHLKITRWCLTYLSYSEFNSGFRAISKSTVSRYPFLGYAAWNWPYHLRSPSAKDLKVVSTFLSTRNSESGGNYGCWMHVLNGSMHPETLKKTQPLYYAASFGFSPLVEAMLLFDDSLDLEEPGGRAGSTALQVACFRRQKEVTQMLIEAGADFLSRHGNFPNRKGITSLWWAETNGWVDLVALMTSIMTQKKIRAVPEDPYPIQYIQEVQKADARQIMHIMEGGQTELLDKKLVATEVPRRYLSKSKMERFLERRFGKGNFIIDILVRHMLSGIIQI
ncbi:hypothetical protein H9Q69_013208 [Fusarium xylarioides]|nr:hypothetical protein H9Q69_013208 [Fusarium xylarioides]